MAEALDVEFDPRLRIILAADVANQAELDHLIEVFGLELDWFKFGIMTQGYFGGPQVLKRLVEEELQVMADLKLHDVPYIMAGAAAAAAAQGAKFITAHASAGVEALKAVIEVKGQAQILGVTVLTSLDEKECRRIYGTSVEKTVLRLADNARQAGCDGLVCAPHELKLLRRYRRFDRLIKVTPNIRPAWAATGDQNRQRSMTPAEAVAHGADYLVIGRPLTHPPKDVGSPAMALHLICDEMRPALKKRGGWK